MTRLAYGALLLSCPDAVARAVGAGRLDGRDRLVARILGARHVGQALLGSVSPSSLGSRTRTVGVAVDMLHALSMVALSAVDPSRRRLALSDAAVATGFAAAGRLQGEPAGEPA